VKWFHWTGSSFWKWKL